MQRTFDQLTSVRVEKKNRIESFFAQRQKDVSNLINTEDLQAIFKSIQPHPSPLDAKLEDRFNPYLDAYLDASQVYDKLILMKGKQTYTFPFHQADQTHFQ